MNTPISETTPVPNENLSKWLFAVRHCIWAIKCRVRDAELAGFDATYDRRHLETMEDLEMFLKMSWDKWLDDLDAVVQQCRVNAEGTSNG
jgi:hypothetical protein